jgi:hypothetical protein
LDLSCVKAEVSILFKSHCLSFSSELFIKISKRKIINLNGLKEKLEDFHFIILLEVLVHSDCQSSSIGFNNICIDADSSSSNFENEFAILFIGSLSSF